MKRSHQDQSKRYLSGKRNTGCHHTYEKYAGRRHVTFFRQSYRSLVVVDKNDKILGMPEDDVDQLMVIMTENRIRHIPIIEDGKLVGLVSIGDAVKALLTVQDVEIRYLKEFIEGKYPA
jgi:predicted transcriptional regulator